MEPQLCAKLNIVKYALETDDASKWTNKTYNNNPAHFVALKKHLQEYRQVEEFFMETNKKQPFKVTRIERIQNPYLLGAFLLKAEEMKKQIKREPEVRFLFHGTKRAYVESIARDNLDWRIYNANKFGNGVNFTPISNYATHYCDKGYSGKVMLVFKVLVGETCIGHRGMELPDENCDTAMNKKGSVIVKFNDNEYYPAYNITYCVDQNSAYLENYEESETDEEDDSEENDFEDNDEGDDFEDNDEEYDFEDIDEENDYGEEQYYEHEGEEYYDYEEEECSDCEEEECSDCEEEECSDAEEDEYSDCEEEEEYYDEEDTDNEEGYWDDDCDESAH